MNPSSPRVATDPPPNDRFARLLELGFEQVVPGPTTTESVRLDDGTHKLTQIRDAMGSFVAVTVLHESAGLAEHAIGTAFEEMDRNIGLLNRFDGASALSALNDGGHLADAPPELTDVIERGLAYGRHSGGAFDITVKPIIDLYRDPATYAPRTPPTREEIDEAAQLVGAAHVEVTGRQVRLARSGMTLTLDGIAKGYVVDGMAAALGEAGATRFLINAGGDIRTGGDRGDARPWTIAVRDPRSEAPSWNSASWDDGIVPEAIRVANGAVATSGSYEVYFDHQQRAHHIVRAETGGSPAEALSVTVTAATTIEADALATAVFVLGPRRGRELIDGMAGCECLVIDRNGNQVYSRGWRRGTTEPTGR